MRSAHRGRAGLLAPASPRGGASVPRDSQLSERRSVAITTNLDFGQWNTVINGNRVTAALIGRLVHHGHVLAFTGKSYRLRNARSQLNVPRESDGMDSEQKTPNLAP